MAAANSKLTYLRRAVKIRGIPAENVFSTHGSFASQRRQGSRAALVVLVKDKSSPQKMQYNAPAELPLGMLHVKL